MHHFNFFLLKNNFKKYENFNIKIFPNSLYSSINLFLIKKFISFFVICILHYIYIYIFLNLIVFKKYFENKFYHSY